MIFIGYSGEAPVPPTEPIKLFQEAYFNKNQWENGGNIASPDPTILMLIYEFK